MNRTARILFTLTLLSVLGTHCAVAGNSQDESALRKAGMDTLQDLKEEVQDALNAQSDRKAIKVAEELAKLLQREKQYWVLAKQPDVVRLAEESLSASRQILSSAKAGRWDHAANAFKALEATCTSCHDLHPEQRAGQSQPRLVLARAKLPLVAPSRDAGPQSTQRNAALARNPDGTPDLSGIWQALSTANWDIQGHQAQSGVPAGPGIVEGNEIPYQPWAAAQKKKNYANRATADPEAKCYVPGVPRLAYVPFPFQISQTPGQLTILSEYVHTVRVIFTNGSSHPPGHIDWWMGDSRGHWENDTLVVDAIDFNDQTWFDHAGNFHSDALHVIERYTPVDADHINYEATIEDPKVFAQPWKISLVLYRHKEKNFQLLEYECYGFDVEKYYP